MLSMSGRVEQALRQAGIDRESCLRICQTRLDEGQTKLSDEFKLLLDSAKSASTALNSKNTTLAGLLVAIFNPVFAPNRYLGIESGRAMESVLSVFGYRDFTHIMSEFYERLPHLSDNLTRSQDAPVFVKEEIRAAKAILEAALRRLIALERMLS